MHNFIWFDIILANEMRNNMIINMQYPHDLSNQKFDGKIHEIIPTSLIKINGNNDFYV